jgi:heat shock protein HslJ
MLLLLAVACAPADPDAAAPGNASGDEGRAPAAGVDTIPARSGPDSPDHAGYRAGGNEPFWTITFGETMMDFADMGTTTEGSATRPDPERLEGGWRFTAESGGRPFVVEIEDRYCQDSMSARPFPHSVTVMVDGQTYTGCGGDTASLLTGDEWRVTRLEGDATDARRQPTMSFGAGGALTGHGGCNRYRAAYEITGEGVEIGPPIATLMACAEPELNEQETRFLALLDSVTRFDISDDGSLQLYAMDGAVIIARR